MAPPVPAGRSLRRAPRPSVVSWPLVAQVASGSWPAAAAPCVPRPLPRAAAAPASQPRSVAWLPRALVGPSPGPGLPCLPPAPPLGPCARWRAPWALAAPVWFAPCHPLRLRAPCSVALAPLRRGCSQRVGRGGAAAGPLRGFGPGGSPPCPRCAAFGRAFSSRGPGFGCARGPARACWRFSGFCVLRCLGLLRCAQARFRGSPCFPPPCRPAGALGEREASGLSAAFRGPLAAAPRPVGGLRCAVFGSVDNPKIVNWVLTLLRVRAILFLRGPFRSLNGAALTGIQGRQKTPHRIGEGFFYRSGPRRACPCRWAARWTFSA